MRSNTSAISYFILLLCILKIIIHYLHFFIFSALVYFLYFYFYIIFQFLISSARVLHVFFNLDFLKKDKPNQQIQPGPGASH